MLRELGIKRMLVGAAAMGLATGVSELIGAGALGVYGAMAVGGTVFVVLFERADRRGEIHWSK